MSEWYEEHPEVANLLHHIQDEGLYEEMSNGYIKHEDFLGKSKYAHLMGIIRELELIHNKFSHLEERLFAEMNRFLPEEEYLCQ